MSRPKIVVHKDKLRMLRYLQETAPGPRSPAIVSVKKCAADTGFSISKVKYLLREAVEEGLLTVEARYLPSGSQVENAYRLTRTGKRRMESSTQEE